MKERHLDRRVCLLILVFVLLAMTACGKKEQSPVTNEEGNNADSYSINIENYSFSPKDLTVPVGTAVSWTNLDSVTHTVEGEGFTSSGLSKGDTFTFTFNSIGIYEYDCGPHPSMKGTITVE